MPLLPSRYNTKNGHISEAEINASLKTDNWAALSWNPPTLALYKRDTCCPYVMPFKERSNRNTATSGRLYGTQLWQVSKIKWCGPMTHATLVNSTFLSRTKICMVFTKLEKEEDQSCFQWPVAWDLLHLPRKLMYQPIRHKFPIRVHMHVHVCMCMCARTHTHTCASTHKHSHRHSDHTNSNTNYSGTVTWRHENRSHCTLSILTWP